MSEGPRTRKRARASASDDQNQLSQVLDVSRSHIVMIYAGRRVLVPRPTSHLHAANIATDEFGLDVTHNWSFSTNELAFLDGELTEISVASWRDIIPFVSRINLDKKSSLSPSTFPFVYSPSPPLRPRRAQLPSGFASVIVENSTLVRGTPKLSINVGYNGDWVELQVRPTTLVKTILKATAAHLGMCESELRITYDGHFLRPENTISECDCEDGDSFDALLHQTGGKPVIYLLPPSGEYLEARVSLRLSSAWSFSAVYPVGPMKRVGAAGGEEISWSVLAKDNGTLHDKLTNCDIAYLFWEAETNPKDLDSPPASPTLEDYQLTAPTPAVFDPRTCTLTPSDSVLVSIEAIPTYLDKALAALELHVEARTSFITYWLPSLLKHKFLALRFVPQQEYEQAARLDVTPTPDVILRIFMVFQGVDPATRDNDEWHEAVARAKQEPEFWRDVVGLGHPSMSDTSKFRVLEWGGMEVKN